MKARTGSPEHAQRVGQVLSKLSIHARVHNFSRRTVVLIGGAVHFLLKQRAPASAGVFDKALLNRSGSTPRTSWRKSRKTFSTHWRCTRPNNLFNRHRGRQPSWVMQELKPAPALAPSRQKWCAGAGCRGPPGR